MICVEVYRPDELEIYKKKKNYGVYASAATATGG